MLKFIIFLVFFTTSSLQFSLVLSVELKLKQFRNENKFKNFFKFVLGSELWGLFFILTFQDLPFFVIRLLFLILYDSFKKNSILYFFVIKNFLLCIFEIYHVSVILIEYKYEGEKHSGEEPEVEIELEKLKGLFFKPKKGIDVIKL